LQQNRSARAAENAAPRAISGVNKLDHIGEGRQLGLLARARVGSTRSWVFEQLMSVLFPTIHEATRRGKAK